MSDRRKTLLVNMPFGQVRWPNLGLSLLKAQLTRRSMPCAIVYLNFDFAEMVGLDLYTWVADRFAFVLGGERLFARSLFKGRLPSDDRYWHDVLLPGDPHLSEADRRDFEAVGCSVEPFLQRCASAFDWTQYAVVGFATNFQQTVSSLCLASRIKAVSPSTAIVFGGAACEGPMGVELLRQFPWIDYVFLGEADESFPQFVDEVLAGEVPHGLSRVAGAAGRDSLPPAGSPCRYSSATACAETGRFVDLNALPDPDFDDYFARWRRSPIRAAIDPLLYFETSRGCWWGQKRHCAFCGLNGSRLVFRSKEPKRAFEELRRLVQRYGISRACSADNNFDPRYFDTLLPLLAEADFPLAFVYEMKTNLRREQADALLRAGLGAAQLGIETFSTPILKLIGKGATAVHNVQALKWFSEAGIEVKWNLLYGFPMEPPEEYKAIAQLLPAIVHLAPPLAVGRVRMDRFSPYFERPSEFGLLNPRPHRAFGYVYPFDRCALANLAYYYEFDFADGRDPWHYAAPVVEMVEQWQANAAQATLNYYDRPDGVLILTDTRPIARQFQARMTGAERELYLFADTGRSFEELARRAGQCPDASLADEGRLAGVLSRWTDARWAVHLDDRWLSLAVRAAAD